MKEEYAKGNLTKASELGDAMLTEHWRSDDPYESLADDMFNIGVIHDELGQYDRAISLYSDSVCYLAGTGDFLALALRYSNLGGALAHAGALEPAKHFFEQAKRIYKHDYGKKHPLYADMVTAWLTCYSCQKVKKKKSLASLSCTQVQLSSMLKP